MIFNHWMAKWDKVLNNANSTIPIKEKKEMQRKKTHYLES